jgi:N-methylhydantoinase B/oxoprolinase/acetone carboxylase alpha subunit
MIEEFSIRKNSGGEGDFKGGEGVSRTYRFLKPVTVNLLTERRIYAPWGVNGAKSGARGENEHFYAGKWHPVGGKADFEVKAGEKVRIKTPGGGGFNTSDTL